MQPSPKFFASSARFRAWLEAHHDRKQELWVGFYKRDSGLPSITWRESVDTALCFGWIDGVRKSIDETCYTIRFTPRKARSKWSAINLKRMQELLEASLVHPAGLRVFTERVRKPSGYTYEQKQKISLAAADEELFRADAKAWQFFESRPNWYRKTSLAWVVSAKKEETRRRRLKQLMEDSRHERTIAPLTRKPKQG